MSPNYARAAAFAALCHEGQVRKGANTPYIGHPVAVSALVIEHGGDEDQAIAALLHDVVEDCDVTPGYLRQNFGARVAEIVGAATDGVPGADGRKAPWKERKTAYLARLAEDDADALLVICCDKVHNAESIVHDLEGPPGLTVFDRFSSTATQTAWYYGELAAAMLARHQDLPGTLILRLAKAAARIKEGARLFNEVREAVPA